MRRALLPLTVMIGIALARCGVATAETPKTGSSTTGLFDQRAFDDGFGKLPTNISSDSLTFNAKSRIFAYQGNVVVTQGDMRLTAKTLEGTYNEQNQLQKLIAKGDVFISKQDIEATGQVASYDAVSSIVTLTDNPQLQQKESILRADRIKIFLNENRSQAEGDVRVTFVNTKGGGLKPAESVATNPAAGKPTPAPSPAAKNTPTAKKAGATKSSPTKKTKK